MSDKRYEANIIRATAVEPANNLETTSAPGVWSLDEVMELQKKNKWPTVGNESVNLETLFSSFMYDGTGAPQVINNGVALGNSNAGSSVEFAGGSGTKKQSLSYANNSNYVVGNSNNFTIEFFVFLRATNDNLAFGLLNDYNGYLTGIYITSGNLSGFFQTGASAQTQITTGQTLSTGQFYHIALVRNGTAFAVYLDGTSVGTATSSSNIQNAGQFLSIGNYTNSDGDTLNGFVSNFRYSSTARYTGNFTPTTSNFTSDSDTILLSCQGQTADLSSNSIAVTEGGSSPTLHDNFGPFTGTSGKGGLVWIKGRTDPGDGAGVPNHILFDTVRGDDKYLRTSNTDSQGSGFSSLFEFNASGFTVGNNHSINYGSGSTEYIAWAFAEQAKFFDIVQFTGDGENTRTLSHNIGGNVGMVLIKGLNETEGWVCYHRSLPTGYVLQLNTSNAQTNLANSIDHISGSTITLSKAGNPSYSANDSGVNYIAYIFAHNNNDGGFGPDGSADVIKCGSFSHTSGTPTFVDCGFEAGWIMVKRTDASDNWWMADNMRGLTLNGLNSAFLAADLGSAEGSSDWIGPNAQGFDFNYLTGTYLYMAIARTPQATPTTGTDVFTTVAYSTSSGPFTIDAGFPPDMAIAYYRNTASGNSGFLSDRIRGKDRYLFTPATTAEGSVTGWANYGASMKGIETAASGSWTNGNNFVWWNWKRAPGYFDITTWTGTGSARTVSHNLGVVPEMIWVKDRDAGNSWAVYYGDNTDFLVLNDTAATADDSRYWNDTSPTSSVFTVGTENNTNASGNNFIAYLFATVAGVSKVGSYTGDSSDGKIIDCGFTSGARFVLIKCTTTVGDWFVFDTERGIVAGNDPKLALNDTAAEVSSYDYVEPHSSGFKVNTIGSAVNGSGKTFMFYAIA